MGCRVVAVATARPTFVVEAGTQLWRSARAELEVLGGDVVGPADPVQTLEEAAAVAGQLPASVDLYVLCCATFADAGMAQAMLAAVAAPVLLWAFREPGPVGDRLWLNSLCGANLAAHALVAAGRKVRLLYGDPGEPAVEQKLRAALTGDLGPAPTYPRPAGDLAEAGEVQHALDLLWGVRVGMLGDAPAGFTPCAADAEALRALLGVELDMLPLEEAFAAVEAVEPGRSDAQARAGAAQSPSLRDFDDRTRRRYGAVTTAVQDWTNRAGLSAAAVRCWPEFPTVLGHCPCSALGRVAAAGTPAVCERDVNGAVTMLLLEAFDTGPTYLVDLVEILDDQGAVRVWHCGSAPVTLAADPDAAAQSMHCNRRIGIAGNFPLRTGRVTLARLDLGPGGWRMLVTGGESVPAVNRFQGNSATVRLDGDASRFVHELVALGFPHHTVLAWADVRPQLRRCAELLGIPVAEW